MNSTVLTCSVCGSLKTISIDKISVPKKESIRTFCVVCAGLTLHSVATSPAKTVISLGLTNMPPAFSFQSNAGFSGDVSLSNTNGLLWKSVQDAFASNGVTMAEFLRCDATTQARLLSAVGFSGVELSRILQLAETNNVGQPKNEQQFAGGQKAAEGAGAELEAAQSTVTVEHLPHITNEKPEDASAVQHDCGVLQGSDSDILRDTLCQGPFVQEDDAPIARCSVYPNLPAEFWCSLCGVLVSSRCHVTGIHKDHPFITLRQAAEAHLQDLSLWSERCRSQLNIANSVFASLHRGKELLSESLKHQEKELERQFKDIIFGLTQWKEELKSSMRLQVNTQLQSIDMAGKRTTAFIDHYARRQACCEALLNSIPPVHQVDRRSEEWSFRLIDLVCKLKKSSIEPIPMPRLMLSEVKSFATPATYMDLLKAVSVPVGVRIPEVLDSGYLNFPTPSSVAQVAFTLQLPDDANERGVLIYSGRTLTRASNIIPTHSLVCASRVFYNGITAWEVHVDRLGDGPGRVLAGVLIAGTDGEGVVWDGHRIVGPSEGECRLLPDRYKLKAGVTLLFVLELEAPSYFLICFFENELVARVPLPPGLGGWIPAFSVFGPQDQLTVVPLSTTVAASMVAGAAQGNNAKTEETEGIVKARLSEQEQRLNALHQQLLAVNSKVDQVHYEKFMQSVNDRDEKGKNKDNDNIADNSTRLSFLKHTPPNSVRGTDAIDSTHAFECANDLKTAAIRSTEATVCKTSEALSLHTNPIYEQQGRVSDSYSPELRSLLNFVESIK